MLLPLMEERVVVAEAELVGQQVLLARPGLSVLRNLRLLLVVEEVVVEVAVLVQMAVPERLQVVMQVVLVVSMPAAKLVVAAVLQHHGVPVGSVVGVVQLEQMPRLVSMAQVAAVRVARQAEQPCRLEME